jgi:hypothetical protein
MGSKRNDQTPAPSRTETVSAYDEAFAVSEDGRPVPMGRGKFKTAGRFVICPFYGQRVWYEPTSGGKK